MAHGEPYLLKDLHGTWCIFKRSHMAHGDFWVSEDCVVGVRCAVF